MNHEDGLKKQKENNFQDLIQIFMPEIMAREKIVKTEGKRFVHYTSAEAAAKIIQEKKFWMRQAECMNDYMEVQHGLECLVNTYRVDKSLKTALDNIFSGISGAVENEFNRLFETIRRDIFMACVSEHENYEDRLGRLSMWRSYGVGSGVAIVLRHHPFFVETNALKAISVPVEYLDQSGFATKISKLAERMNERKDLLQSFDQEYFKQVILNVLKITVVATKHIGFSEEKEWRVIYFPTVDESKFIKPQVVTIAGIPQKIYSIPLKNVPHEGVSGLEISGLIDEIIIGPTAYPLPISKAFIHVLEEAGVSDAYKKVSVSDIPLRT